jgi:hypothetical protein
MAAAQKRNEGFMDAAFVPRLSDVCADLWIFSTFRIFP